MPAVVDSNGTRVSFKGMSEDNIRRMRENGEVSCAECRRCRIKCDKKVPCGSCTRKQCASLCPNDVLKQTKEPEPVSGELEKLQAKVAEQEKRIRELEDGLSISHAYRSNATHPLLHGTTASNTQPDSPESAGAEGDITGVFELLKVADPTEEVSRLGISAESVLLADRAFDLELEPIPVPPKDLSFDDVQRCQQLHPFDDQDQLPMSFLDEIVINLPLRTRAVELCHIYLEYSWYFRPMTSEDLLEDVFTLIYDNNDFLGLLRQRPHLLSNVFAIFSIGAMLDPGLASFPSPEADIYYKQARRSLNLKCIFTSADFDTVMAIAHIGSYQSCDPSNELMNSAWLMTSLAIKIAEKLSLHREPLSCDLTEHQIRRRRRLFWELVEEDWIASLVLSRPPGISSCHIDCKFPSPERLRVNEHGKELRDYDAVKYYVTKELIWPVLELATRTNPPNYATILELDRRIRALDIPQKLELTEDEKKNPTQGLRIREYVTMLYRPLSLMFIHRSFFISAITLDPLNPLCGPYAPSVLAAFCCSSFLIRTFSRCFDESPESFLRFWTRWTHIFSAAVIMGSIAIRAPLAAPSTVLDDLDLAVRTYEKAAPRTRRARAALPFLKKLQAKAHFTYNNELKVLFADPLEPPEAEPQSADLGSTPSPYTTPNSSEATTATTSSEEASFLDFQPYMDDEMKALAAAEPMSGVKSGEHPFGLDSFLLPKEISMLVSDPVPHETLGDSVDTDNLVQFPLLPTNHVFFEMDMS